VTFIISSVFRFSLSSLCVVQCRSAEPPKKVWQPPSKQKEMVKTVPASQSRTTNKNVPHRLPVSSAREFDCLASKAGSVSSREVIQDAASKVSSVTAIVRESTAATENRPSSSVPLVVANTSAQPPGSNEMPSGSRRLSDVNEPTKQPVAARLAAWKKKTAAAENVSTSSQHHMSRERLHTISEASGTVKHATDHRASQVDSNTTSPVAVSTEMTSSAVSITNGWSADRNEKFFPPLKDGEVRQRTLPRRTPQTKQETMHPARNKLGPATLEIRQKLTEMCENWKSNEIAEKSRKERSEDLAALESRWRNGNVADNQEDLAVISAACLPSTESAVASHNQVHWWTLCNL